MARIKETQIQVGTCGECAHGEWIMEHWNLDLKKRPICVRCPYSEFAMVRSQRGCKEHFQQRINND